MHEYIQYFILIFYESCKIYNICRLGIQIMEFRNFNA